MRQSGREEVDISMIEGRAAEDERRRAETNQPWSWKKAEQREQEVTFTMLQLIQTDSH